MESARTRYLRKSCWRIRKRTSGRSERVSFLIQKQRVCKYRTKHFPWCNLFILYLLRFSDRIDRMKNSYGIFFIQSQSRIDLLTRVRGKSRFIQSEISCQNESVSSQTRSRCFWRLFNLYSQKFVEFPQVYSSFLEHLP